METLQIDDDIICTTLADHKELHQKTLTLIEENFNYEKKYQYKVDFYLLMNPLNAKHNHILIDRGTRTVLGHIGVCMRTIIIGNYQTNVALLGGIAIHPNYQKKGYLKKLMTKVIHQYQKKVSLFMLWSNLDNIYQQYDFFQINGQIQTGIKDINHQDISGFKKTKFSSLSTEEFVQIKNLYQKYFCQTYTTFQRNEKIWESIRKIESTALYLEKDTKNRIVSYFCVGKGQDLQNIIHELVYEPGHEDIIDQLSQFKLWLPQAKFDKKTTVSQLIYMALFKIGNPNHFEELVLRWSQGRIVIRNISRDEVNFLYEKNSYKRQPKDFLMDLFGYPPIKEFENFANPIYISGLDSV